MALGSWVRQRRCAQGRLWSSLGTVPSCRFHVFSVVSPVRLWGDPGGSVREHMHVHGCARDLVCCSPSGVCPIPPAGRLESLPTSGSRMSSLQRETELINSLLDQLINHRYSGAVSMPPGEGVSAWAAAAAPVFHRTPGTRRVKASWTVPGPSGLGGAGRADGTPAHSTGCRPDSRASLLPTEASGASGMVRPSLSHGQGSSASPEIREQTLAKAPAH